MRRLAPCAAANTAFLCLTLLYATGRRALYHAVIIGWGVTPFDPPFVDTHAILSSLRCARLGVDVLATNPCDVLARVFDYSPLWLALAALPVTDAWLLPAGLAVDAAFLLCLLLLPTGRGWRQTMLVTAGALSSATAFARERGNNALLMFRLAAAAAALACRGGFSRALGYGLALLAGLLKYYPMPLLLLATRERPQRLLATLLAATAAVAIFIAVDGDDLARALALIPFGAYFGGVFGASTLPGGLAQLLGLQQQRGFTHGLELVLVIAALTAGGLLGRSASVRDDLAALTERERSFLLAGAVLVLSCFLTAQNIGYRAVHLVLLLPSLAALPRVGRHPRLYAASVAVVLGLLWSDAMRHCIAWLIAAGLLPGAAGAGVWVLAWLLREAGWWAIVTLLATLLTSLLLHSEAARQTARLWPSRHAPVRP